MAESIELEETLSEILNDLEGNGVNKAANDIAFDLEANLSPKTVEKGALRTFGEKVLTAPIDLVKWLFKTIKEKPLEVLMTGAILYPLIKNHFDKAEETGKRVKLSDAIAGAKKILVDNYDKTIHDVAVKTKNDPNKWDKLDKDTQKKLESQIAMTGDVYWSTIGEEIMEKLAEMPIYDPSS